MERIDRHFVRSFGLYLSRLLDDLWRHQPHAIELAAHGQNGIHLAERTRRSDSVHRRQGGFPKGRVRKELLGVSRRESTPAEIPHSLRTHPKRDAIVDGKPLRVSSLQLWKSHEIGDAIHFGVGISDE